MVIAAPSRTSGRTPAPRPHPAAQADSAERVAPGPARHRAAGPGKPTRRFRRGLLAVGVAGAVGLATFWGLSAAGVTSGTKVLTTSQVAVQTNPGLVVIYTTLGFQHAQAAGTGMVVSSSGEVLTNN